MTFIKRGSSFLKVTKMIEEQFIQEYIKNFPIDVITYTDILESYADIISESMRSQKYTFKIKDTSKKSIIVNEYDSSDEEKPKKVTKKRKNTTNEEENIETKQKTRKRAPAIPWNEDEENALIEGLKKYGLGNWAKIHSRYIHVFEVNGRSSSDLSKKWLRMRDLPEYENLQDTFPVNPKINSKVVKGQSSISSFFTKK